MIFLEWNVLLHTTIEYTRLFNIGLFNIDVFNMLELDTSIELPRWIQSEIRIYLTILNHGVESNTVYLSKQN